MTGWDDGYVTDITYTNRFYRETTPVWLATAALLLGHRPPDLAAPFRYADLGCGHGLTAIIVAATCPQAEVWGFDFNPAHVESARALANRAGIGNVRFEEASFAALAALSDAALPEFDIIVAHGVASWVSAENRAHMTEVVGQRLRAGGLAYLSYNVATGWGAMPPLRALMRMLMLAGQERSDQSAASVLESLDRLRQAGARFFSANPEVVAQLAEIGRQDPRYVAHEFLNQDWQPLMFSDMAERMAALKCRYIGSAALTENVDVVSVPPELQATIRQMREPMLRETLRDFAIAQQFRRDIYRRGVLPITSGEHLTWLDTMRFAWLGRPVEDPITLPTPLGIVTGVPGLYGPLVEQLQAGVTTFGAIRTNPALAGRPVPDLLQSIVLLLSGGYIHPTLPPAVTAAAEPGVGRLNRALAEMAALGDHIGQLVSPLLGSALPAELVETLVVREIAAGRSLTRDPLAERLLEVLEAAGMTLRRDPPPADRDATRTILAREAESFLANRLPPMTRLGMIPGGNETAG